MNEVLNPPPDDDMVPISTGRLKGVEFDIAVAGRPDDARQEIAFTVRLQRLSSKGLDDLEDTQVRSQCCAGEAMQKQAVNQLSPLGRGCPMSLHVCIAPHEFS